MTTATQYLDIQSDTGQLTTSVTPHEQSFSVVNHKPYTVVAVIAVPLTTFETRTYVAVGSAAGVTGETSSTGAINDTVTIPAGESVVYSLSSTYSSPVDEQSADIDSASQTAVLTVTITTYNGVGLSPQVASTFPLEVAVIGTAANARFGDIATAGTRGYDSRAVAFEFFRAADKAQAQAIQDWMEKGNRNLKDFMDAYDWCLTQGFTGR